MWHFRFTNRSGGLEGHCRLQVWVLVRMHVQVQVEVQVQVQVQVQLQVQLQVLEQALPSAWVEAQMWAGGSRHPIVDVCNLEKF